MSLFLNNFIKALITCPLFFVFLISNVNAEEITLKLKNGDIVSGKLLNKESTSKVKVIISPIYGKISINESDIHIKPSKIEKESKTSTNKESPRSSEIVKKKIEDFSGSLTFGFNGDNHNRDSSLDLNLGFDAIYTLNSYKHAIETSWDKGIYDMDGGTSDNIDVTDTISLNGKSEYYVNDDLSIHLINKYDLNSDAIYGSSRFLSSIGITKYIIDEDKMSLSFELGPAAHYIYGGPECESARDCGDLYYANSLKTNFSKNLTDQITLSIYNHITGTHGRSFYLGNEFTSSLKYQERQDSATFITLDYKNIYQEIIDPSLEDRFSFNIGFNI